MKYSLMSLMLDDKIKVSKPNFIYLTLARNMGFTGTADSSVEEVYTFLNQRGIPVKNGTMSFEKYVKFAKETGYDGVDMMSYHFDEAGADAKDILEKYGISLSAVNIIVPFVNAVNEEKFHTFFQVAKSVIDRAHAAGCRNILLMPSVYQAEPGITREQAFQNIVKGLEACVSYGNGLGMTINTETLESCAVPMCSNGEMLRLFQTVEGLKYTHDTGNPLIANESPAATYKLFKDKVAAVHFKQLSYQEEATPETYRTMDGKILGRELFEKGEVDFEAHLKALKEDNYQGFITLEGTVLAEDSLEGAAKSLAYFKAMEENL